MDKSLTTNMINLNPKGSLSNAQSSETRGGPSQPSQTNSGDSEAEVERMWEQAVE